jgi:hypothetical protein
VGFFGALGWREHEFHSTWLDSIRLGRSVPNAAAWDQFAKWGGAFSQEAVKRMSGIALFERSPQAYS